MRTLLGILLGLVLTGCGSMTIEVSVLDPVTVEHEIDRRLLRETLPEVLGQSEVAVRKSVLDVQQKHFSFLVELSEEYEAKAARKSTSADEKFILREQARGTQASMQRWETTYQNATSDLQKIRTEIVRLHQELEESQAGEKKAIEGRIAQMLRRRNHVLANLQRLVEDEIRKDAKNARDELGGMSEPLQDAARQAVATSRRSLIGDQGLVEDPYAYTVASADEKLWARGFNTVVGDGTFGNLNMAVKMESLGDFTLKGLTFDPSDVARVASKVTTQALLLASQISGVPVDLATSDTSSGGDALRVSSKKLADAQNVQALEEAKIEAHKEGLMAVAATVLREWPSLEKDNQRAAGIAAIKSSFAANKARIKMEQPSDTPSELDDEEEDGGAADDTDEDEDAVEDEDDSDEAGEDEDNESEDEADDDPPGLLLAADLAF